MLKKKKCLKCGNEFVGDDARKFCSRSCANSEARKSQHESFLKGKEILVADYMKDPVKCLSCGENLSYESWKSGLTYCNRTCSNHSRKQSEETKNKISKALRGRVGTSNNIKSRQKMQETARNNLLKLGYEFDLNNDLICSICGYEAKSITGLLQHYNSHVDAYGWTKKRLAKKVYQGTHELDITVGELEEYRKNQLTCEICGLAYGYQKEDKEGKLVTGKLNADHNHTTHKFRGLLCVKCNRALGWFEQYREIISEYVDR